VEQLYSLLIVETSPEHDELKEIGKKCITKHHAYHYFGFARTEWKLFEKGNPPRVKPLLYIFRVLLTGIYLMQTGEIEANLLELNKIFNLSFLPELIERKIHSAEKENLPEANLEFYRLEYERLISELEKAAEKTHLPENTTAKNDLNDLLIRLRLRAFN